MMCTLCKYEVLKIFDNLTDSNNIRSQFTKFLGKKLTKKFIFFPMV